jgi:uncharacterized protein YcaQ
MKTPASMSRAEARATVLAAQGFGLRQAQTEVGANEICALVDRLGVLQLDSVNVFCRSHYMPVFSRLGPYNRALLDRLAGHTAEDQDREFFEYWGHEASLMPAQVYGWLRWRNARADLEAWKFVIEFARDHPGYVEQTLAIVEEQGPINASATGAVRDRSREAEMWNWHEASSLSNTSSMPAESPSRGESTSSAGTTYLNACCPQPLSNMTRQSPTRNVN